MPATPEALRVSRVKPVVYLKEGDKQEFSHLILDNRVKVVLLGPGSVLQHAPMRHLQNGKYDAQCTVELNYKGDLVANYEVRNNLLVL